MSKWILRSAAMAAGCLWLGVAADAQTGSKVQQTRHNLSASGPGPIRVAGADGVCKFCHTPHASNPIAPLWNRPDPGSYYEVYRSSTLEATVGQPTGSSRLCLSCHDGTIALTQTYNSRNAIPGTVYISPQDAGYIGTDLTDDHPISFVYDAALAMKNRQLHNPATLPRQLPLDHEKRLQCTTCHDPHDDSLGKFLRMDNRASAMCTSCHNLDGWEFSGHARSSASVTGATGQRWTNVPYQTVRDLGCESCHRPHGAGGRERLLRYEAEEENCLPCHDGNVAKDIKTDLRKISTHPVRRTTRVHDPVETPLSQQDHVECVDCHNPHQATSGPAAQAPHIKPSMKGASGAAGRRTGLVEARFEYQVCYKCHSLRNPARPVVERVLGVNNIAEEFSRAGAGYHPVTARGRNTNVPSLLQDYETTSRLYCTDCHGSDTPTRAAGPHGSQHKPLLVRNYTTTDGTSESTQAYELCYGCHNRSSILADQSFSRHRKHVVEERTPCSACHDPHGVQQNPHLINFDRFIARPSQTTGVAPTYTRLGTNRGTCSLNCHGEEHNNRAYP